MNTIKISKLLFSTLFLWGTMANAQHLTISSTGETGTSGTNWSIDADVLYIGNSGSASINTSVITNHLQNTGDLIINLPGQSSVGRNIYINNTIAYSGSSARTLTFQSGNDIVFANGVGITSATASLNIVLRTATTTGSPDNGSVTMDGINLDTKGGHIWVGGGATNTSWNGLIVGNSAARTYLDDVAGISVVGSTIASGGGDIYLAAQSWNSSDDDGVNYGMNIQNSNISSGVGDIYLFADLYGRYTNGIGLYVRGTTSITSTTGPIYVRGYGLDATTNGNSWRHAASIEGGAQIKSVSGSITVIGDAAFTATVNDKEGLNITDGASICSQTGNITLRGTNTLESSGQYSNSIRFAAANAANSIRIGYDGTNAYSGNITIEGNSIYQRSTHLGAGSISVRTTGTLTIQPTGNAFTYMRAANSDALTYDDDWNFGTNLGGFVYGKSTNTTAITFSNALTTSGPITIYAGSIIQNGAFSTTSASGNISLLSKTHITNSNATTITTQGGDVLFASNVDDATDGESTTNGYIQLRSGITVNTNGGDITFGGGNTTGSDYSLGSSDEAYTEGVRLDGVIALNSGGGNISMRGKSYARGVQSGWGASGIGFYYFSAATGIINSGTGTITIDGYSQTQTSTYASGLYFMHNISITSANTTDNAINITGKATGASGEAWGIESESTLSVLATGTGGGITINTSTQLTNSFDAVLRSETNILALSGPINFKTGQLSGAANNYLYLNGHMYLGSKAGSAVTSSSSNINMQVDRYWYASGALPKLATSGSVTIQPNSTSFGADIYTSYFSLNQNSQTMSGFTFGKSGNIGNLYLNTAVTSTGAVNIYGATIGITGALTASGSDVSLYASTAVTQSEPIVSSGLSLNGIGTFTLTNTSNNFATLAGGAVGSLLGATQIVDISGGLTIGTIGSNTGIKGSGVIRVETLAGDLTLAGSISTTSTSTDAVILTAAKSTAIGVPTGGDIIVSGSPTITMGTGAITKLYSGYDVTSTGLTDLAGGASNARYNYDETTTTFNPTLSANNKYAIYRTALGYGDLNIVSSGGDAEGSTWTYANGVIKTTSGTANVLNTAIETKLNSGNLSIEANKITFSANVTGTTNNSLSILSKTHIVNTNATIITTQGGNVLFASNVDDVTDNENTVNGYIVLGSGLTINTNGGNITFGGGNTSGTDYALGTSVYPFEGIRFDGIINLNSGGGNISMRGKSYAISTTSGAWGVGFWNLSTGSITSGIGTITLDGFSQSSGGTHNAGLYSYGALTLTSANTTSDAIRLIGKSTGTSGEAWGIESESALSVIATGTGGGITLSSSQQNSANNYDVVLRGETNILATSGPINLLGGQSGGLTSGTLLLGNNLYLGSKASSAVLTSSSNIAIQYHLYNFSGYTPKLATTGTLDWTPVLASFGQNVATDFFSWSQNGQTLSGLTIGKSGNIYNVSMNSVITTTGPVNVYGASIGITGALTASGSDVSLYASTAVTQSQPIVSSGLSLNGTGTFTLTNTSNNFTTLAGGAVGSLLGATQITDVSGGLTIGTIASNSGLSGSSTIRVETLADDLTFAGSISTTSTSTDAVILNAAKNNAIGIGIGGDIIVSGAPTITMGSGGIAKLFSGLESTSTGLTSLAGGSSNVRNNYDETTTTFSPVLSANNKYAIYRTSAGVGDLTIVSSNGDAINSTWSYENGIINTKTTPVNILSSVIESYLASGPLTINAGNTTVSSAISSTSSNALVLNANSTLSNTTPTTTVNAAITNAGSITINTGTFNIAQNITTTSTAAIAISATNQISTSTATRRTISTQGGNISLIADFDANGIGQLDIDDLTLNPGAGNLIVRGETFNINPDQSRKTYINGTGSFTFESTDASFGHYIESAWFVIDQDANGISALNIGKSGSSATVYINSAFTITGPINVYGGYVEVSGTVTSSGNFDILLKGITNSGSCINVYGAITKSSGTGTLLMQGHGRVINSGTISATGTGVLNVVMWSDYDGDNVGGGSTLNGGSVSTNGGHVWIGGSNSNGGTYTWNGLAVGDGPSIGTASSNCHAIDFFAPITTAGGDVLLWAGDGGCGTSGIQSDGSRHINAGSGDITLIAYQTGGAIELTSTGVISLLPHAGGYAAALTLGGTLTSGHFTFNTSYYNGLKINSLANSGLVIGNYSGHLSGTTAVTQGNSSNVTVSSALSTKSLEIYGGAIALNENLTTSGVNADMLIKGKSNINLAASKTITTAAGDVNLWADSDDNSTGYVQLLAGATINSTGGDINLGGGSDLTTDYAYGTTAETCPEVVGTQYISGVHFRQSSSLNSNGGNISVRGQNANTSAAAMSFGISLRGVTMNSGTGRIAINGIANGSGSVNAQAVASWGTLTLRSASTSADAISITGNALSSVGGSSLGVNAVALFEATGVGGGITITGKSGVASTNASVNLGGDILAASGPITISGENISGVVDNIMIGSTTTIGKKSGSNVTTSSSNVILEGNRINTPGSVFVDCSGTLTVQPFGDSFASALTWPMTNVTHASSLSGLTIGKATNTSDVTFANATTIGGPITAYGGAITVSAAVTAAGNILLDGDTGSFLSQNTKGISINAAVTTSNNGNITILGRGGSATAVSTHGINVTNLVEAGGTGNIELIGYGGLSTNGVGSSCHGVNIEGASAWVKSNGGNVSITGYGGGSGVGTYSQGVPILTNAKVSAGGSGTVTITGTGGVNTAIGLRGIVITSGSSVYSAGGAISITGTNGTNGSDNSDGVTLDTATIGSSTSGPITVVGTAGGGTGSDAISLSTTNTIGGGSHASNITLRGNNMALAGTNSVLTTGQVTIEPYSNSFTSALVFPIANLTLANTITGLTLGKLTNSSDITFNSNTTVAGPITAYGGTITLNANLTTTNNGTISLYTDNPLEGLSTARTLNAAGAFKYIPRGTAFSAAVTYPITNLSATCTGLTIGNVTNNKDITINTNVEGAAGIELYGNNLGINANLVTTSGADMYLKGTSTIASSNYIASNGDFTHDGNLIFKSDATGTAAFGALGGTFTTVSGSATTERYIPAKRAWRLLTAPVKGSTNTTIPANWQGVNGEGLLLFSPATYQSNTMTGYTTGGGSPNLWKYNNGWQSIPNLTAENLFTSTVNNGFLVFATGPSDSANIITNATATTLKPTGDLITGNVPHALTANEYKLIGNPYASPINTVNLAASNLGSKIWMVDPSLGNFGGYAVYDGSNWTPAIPTTNDTYIQSGQGFFVLAASNATFTISESHKVSGNSNTWFQRSVAATPTNESADKLRVLLYKQDNAEWKLADGILAVNSASGNNEVDKTDTGKMSNFNENLLFRNGTSNLAIEYRGLPNAGTTQPMRLTGTTVQPYQLKVKAESYTNTNLQPYIQDTQLGTVTAIPTDGSEIIIPFTGVAASSTNPDSRFIIIYLSSLSTNNPDVLSVGVYPNPVNTGVFTVSLKENTTPASYTLTNLLGQQVQVGKLMSLNNSVNVTSLQIGIYILQVEQEGKTFSTKLIIK